MCKYYVYLKYISVHLQDNSCLGLIVLGDLGVVRDMLCR